MHDLRNAPWSYPKSATLGLRRRLDGKRDNNGNHRLSALRGSPAAQLISEILNQIRTKLQKQH